MQDIDIDASQLNCTPVTYWTLLTNVTVTKKQKLFEEFRSWLTSEVQHYFEFPFSLACSSDASFANFCKLFPQAVPGWEKTSSCGHKFKHKHKTRFLHDHWS